MKYIILLGLAVALLTGGDHMIGSSFRTEHDLPYVEPGWDMTKEEAVELANRFSNDVTVEKDYIGYFVPNSSDLHASGQLWEIYYAFDNGSLYDIHMKIRFNDMSGHDI
jgi:hypothetical protein